MIGEDHQLIARFLEMMVAESGAARNTLLAYGSDLEAASVLLEGRLATLSDGAAVLAAYAAKHPLGRVLMPRDIAAAIAFLVSPLATGITGTAFPVDAGKGATWDHYATPPWLQG